MGNQQPQPLPNDLSLSDYRYLMKQTRLTPYVIQGWYREFSNLCPSGQLNKEEFIQFYKQLENSDSRNFESIAEHVFEAFDRNGNQYIDFKEFLIAYSITSIGEPAEKLRYTFSLFDADHSESIEMNEMIKLLKKLFLITGNKAGSRSPESIAADIFRKLDIDHNRSLSKEEFINGCLEHPSIRNMLSPFEKEFPPKDW